MGMCLDGKNKLSFEIRNESVVLNYRGLENNGPDKESDDYKQFRNMEIMIHELDDLEYAIQEGRRYIAKERAKKYASDENTKKMLKRDWKDRYIQLKQDVKNRAGGTFRAGEVFKVVENYNGIDIKREGACQGCRCISAWSISNLSESSVILLRKDYDPKKDNTQ